LPQFLVCPLHTHARTRAHAHTHAHARAHTERLKCQKALFTHLSRIYSLVYKSFKKHRCKRMNKGPSIIPIFAQHFNCQRCYKFWLAHKSASGTDYKCVCKKSQSCAT